MAKGDVLIVGKGAREHAFAWKLRLSKHVKRIYAAPGNPGTAIIGENIPINTEDIYRLAHFALEKDVELTIIGPEFLLKLGIVDLFHNYNLNIFGPTAAAAMIETSKLFAKEIMIAAGIPTASFHAYTSYEEANAYIHERELPFVIKADGLAGGKGAYICRNLDEGREALTDLMIKRIHSDAGNIVIIEDFLQGEEISIHALCNEFSIVPLIEARDAKTLKDGNKGSNTGGMGAYSPVPCFTHSDMFHVEQTIIQPLLDALRGRGTVFIGCLYPGLMLTPNGPSVVEFNARFGDPETQVLMALMKNDFFLLLKACINKEPIVPEFSQNKHAVCIVLCSKEYPSSINNPVPIYGVDAAARLSDDVIIFHGATKLVNGQLYTDGGRVLSITAVAESREQARHLAYSICNQIHFKGKQFRRDIAKA